MAKKPELYSAVYPWRLDVPYVDDLPSMTRQEFTAECDVNNIMKTYSATGILPNVDGRTPIYWDAALMPANLQDAMNAMNLADDMFMQLPAIVRKEFDNDAVKFVDYCAVPENLPKLREWGLAPPEKAPDAPMRVEVVNPAPAPAAPTPEPPKGS